MCVWHLCTAKALLSFFSSLYSESHVFFYHFLVPIQLYQPLWLRRPSPHELAMQMAALCIQLDSLVTSPHQVLTFMSTACVTSVSSKNLRC